MGYRRLALRSAEASVEGTWNIGSACSDRRTHRCLSGTRHILCRQRRSAINLLNALTHGYSLRNWDLTSSSSSPPLSWSTSLYAAPTTGLPRTDSRSFELPSPVDARMPMDALKGATIPATAEHAVLNPGTCFLVGFPPVSSEVLPWAYIGGRRVRGERHLWVRTVW